MNLQEIVMFVCDLAGDGRSDEYEWKPVLEFSNRKIAAIESLTRNLCRATQSRKQSIQNV